MSEELLLSVNDFSADIFRALSAANSNLVLSPFSIVSTLFLLLWGSAGRTKESIAETLYIQDYRIIDTLIKKINSYNELLKNEEKTFVINDFFLVNKRNNAELKKSNKFGGKVNIKSFDFANSVETAKQINDLVKENTGGLIKNIIDPSGISKESVMEILNTVYFKGLWEYPFKDDQISEEEFTNSDGTKSLVDMLNSKVYRNYGTYTGRNAEAKIVELPYLHSNLSMLVVLPEKLRIDEFIKKLPEIQHGILSTPLYETRVDFVMPKFKINNDLPLRRALEGMGLSELFTNADLSNMLISNKPVQVGDITHAAAIEVDEKGIKAASATKIFVVSFVYVETVTFVCDRPFLFYIIDRNTRFPLFTGSVKTLPPKFPPQKQKQNHARFQPPYHTIPYREEQINYQYNNERINYKKNFPKVSEYQGRG